MSSKSRRRRGSDQEHRDAASEHENHNTPAPSREEAFAAFCVVLAYATGHAASAVYTQHALPPDAKSADAYARRHRALRAAGIQGVWVRGKTLACTPEAWARELPRAPRLAVIAEPPRDVDAELDAALGIRSRPASR